MFKATLNPLCLEIKLPDSAFGTCLGMVVVFGRRLPLKHRSPGHWRRRAHGHPQPLPLCQ
ncbi:hypothetical protein IVB36_38025 [Bradyrhizobium sp. 35]|uniref:hypothetical protein n=1 Tax=Bradyrhizobium sp. 35 TaxID=2782670 RepID=UPI001FF840F8|nr:hypothetical protein [Bradyrhizobium sp. 35]MCK1456527.1 hypothetical protein [Bradyrhizobium sp. 35]